ncbi:TetR/AcrR family transcriptional regulator [Nocardioides sp. NBC_00163]|uniref:TetR/AcrR family transcriptional regulator n=1 Tax=Nocardioides sp. NBC_00163 TaxID=2975999 RepID=UPI003252ABBF
MASTESAERSGKLSRARIIDTAFEHFGAYGYRGTSLAKIAAEVGISQPGLLHHFPNKSALFMSVLVERDTRDLEAVGMQVEKIAELDADQLFDFFEGLVRHNAENRNMVQLAHLTAAEATRADHPAHEWVVLRTSYFRDLCSAALQKGIDAGQVRKDVDPRAIATMLIAASEGLENQWLVDPSVDLAGSFADFTAMLRRDIAPSGH